MLNTVFGSVGSFAQNKVIEGAVLEKGGTKRLSGATVSNKRTSYAVSTNSFGLFSIIAIPGDTIEVTHPEYASQRLVVVNYSDLIIRLQTGNVLKEVIVKSESNKEQLTEAKNAFKKKGIYYGGRPPLKLLLPFGGSPLTFFYELLSKNGRQARRFGEFAKSETDYYEVAARFNDYNIKRIARIEDKDLPAFKQAFWPSIEQIRTWNDFDLLNYIKASFKKFQSETPPPLDSLKR